MVRRDPGGFTAGLALTIGGGIALPVGLLWLVALYTSDQDSTCTNQSDSTAKCVIAGGIGVLGAAGLATGIPMMVIDGQMVPAERAAPSAAWWVPKGVSVSRSGARVLWTF